MITNKSYGINDDEFWLKEVKDKERRSQKCKKIYSNYETLWVMMISVKRNKEINIEMTYKI